MNGFQDAAFAGAVITSYKIKRGMRLSREGNEITETADIQLCNDHRRMGITTYLLSLLVSAVMRALLLPSLINILAFSDSRELSTSNR